MESLKCPYFSGKKTIGHLKGAIERRDNSIDN
jgi:hypothetical protein